MTQLPHQAWWKNSRGEWYVIIQVFLFALVAFGPVMIDDQPDLPDGWRTAALVIGAVLGIIGLYLIFAGLFRLGTHVSPLPHPVEGAPLIQTGVYGLVRHPIYSGGIIGAVGWGLINVSWLTLLFAVILFFFFDAKSRREERWLMKEFPEYAGYRTRVHKLIPFVY
jgi:protein-S-isoprenylcysteine O-methyltransferase Ste14